MAPPRKQPKPPSQPPSYKEKAVLSHRKNQFGAFLMTRWVLLMLILLAMLVVPIWLKKDNDNQAKEKAKAAAKAESDMNASYKTVPTEATGAVGTAGAQTQSGLRPIGFGLTFAAAAPNNEQPSQPGVSQIGCHGQPAPSDKPNKGTCNPYEGDTSCRVVLPVLCLSAGGGTANIGATAPVMGALLQSRPEANARCEKELGAGWRMADFHASGGWSINGRLGQGMLSSGSTRYWVAIDDQLANCWDSKP